MVEVQLKVESEQGLHGRPADLFVRTANKFGSNLTVRNLSTKSKAVDAKDILKVLSLGVYSGHVIHVIAEGHDESQALRALVLLVQNGFMVQPAT